MKVEGKLGGDSDMKAFASKAHGPTLPSQHLYNKMSMIIWTGSPELETCRQAGLG